MKINKEFFKQGGMKIYHFASKHAPTALVILGTGGFVATVIMACKETPSAMEAIEEAKAENPDISKVDIAVIGAKHYWKPALVGTASLACFIGAHSVDLRRQAALSAAATLSERALKEYKDKVVDEIGETKAQRISDAIAQEHIQSYQFKEGDVPGNGTLFIFDWTRQAFRGDLQEVRKLINDLNDDMFQAKGAAYFSGEITLNDLLNGLASICPGYGLGSVRLGDQMGFRVDLTGPIDLNMTYGHNNLGEPCAHIDVHPLPLTENIRDIYY